MSKVKQVVAIYARTATDDGVGSGCVQQVWSVRSQAGPGSGETVIYADAARSGNDPDRPELRRLLNDVRDGKICRVLVRDMSCLARDHFLMSSILAELKTAGAVVETIERMSIHA